MEADLSDAFLCRSGHRTIRVERRVKSGLVTPQIAPRGHPCLLWLPRPSWVGPRPAARTLQERMGMAGPNDGPLPTDYLGPHFGDGANSNTATIAATTFLSISKPAARGQALLSFKSGANHGIGNQISIPSRFMDHEIDPSFGAHFLIGSRIHASLPSHMLNSPARTNSFSLHRP